MVNTSPFQGKSGKYVTSRNIRERLQKELEVNVGVEKVFDAPEIKWEYSFDVASEMWISFPTDGNIVPVENDTTIYIRAKDGNSPYPGSELGY